ncbi:N-acetylneuraminate synthase [Tropicibacter naphthalenivorans]|uniref:Spore coat polysaccharide biosynthesis protein SpsE n=1 Tax=Tropicibacter naphthalenivorans TaxID=441103 RepID=A0A0P1GKY9_9RHOB|nr:N-acetylneuraminate synthase [Tropicibacter naphthalenivorans]CUH82391.1 Spore coat polysaccharide biosynthesis protein SpsE [Tropicibacter naphthalenivorans]SMD05509.1 N-acetylneuraminate synthase [Tropicibacter naphthalenivorans]
MVAKMANPKTLIIAEAGVNHNGDLNMALELVDKAAEAGADYVKFQTFKATKLASASAKKASYQTRTTDGAESQLAMLQRLELSVDDHKAIMARCDEKGVRFLSTPFDLDSLALLTDTFALPEIKLGSGELTNAPLLLAAGRTGVRIILSTGMGSLSEVEEALGVLAFAMCREGLPKGRTDFADVLLDPAVWPVLAERVMLLHCTTEYPAAVEDTNLHAMETLRRAFGVQVGYSDHTVGEAVSLAAVALGACALEKHFTLDRTLPGPDHAASLEPGELTQLIRGVRAVELALGTGIKQPGAAEVANRAVARKSLLAARDLPEGHVLTLDDIAVKRPGDGISPMALWDMVGQVTTRATPEGDAL